MQLFTKLFDLNQRQLNKVKHLVDEINAYESRVSPLSQEEIRAKTSYWRAELAKLESVGAVQKYLDAILPEAFALVREAAQRTVGMRPFDTQLLAGIFLHKGKITEQKTGEGKTLTATLPIYLNALTGKGVHLVTPNDYLSRHGAGWMGAIYNYLGISVGVIISESAYVYDPETENSEFEDIYARNLREVPRQQAYQCDVTYGTNHHFGFDYLRDNMVRTLDEMVQTNPRGELGAHHFAIVDEVDSILIDNARTPLIIAAQDDRSSTRYAEADKIVRELVKGTDYDVDEKFRSATLTDLGIRRVERMLGITNLYEQDFEMVHLVEQSLSAYALYEKDRDYVVKDGKVIIVDQFTGRLLPTNRYSNGLHQALEAKERVAIQEETRTRAEISYQNYFRMYSKLAGMTGTAVTEAEEFFKIYNLEVVVIPTNRPNIRKDHNDVVYKTESAKFKAVADEIASYHERGQPVLVGTTSVEKSELLHSLLKRRGIPHDILNAKNHEHEAMIISQAGRKGAVTISTNMAGRGVDIILGGDPPIASEQQEVKNAGGLHVIGTERHESRRIDNQLRGRAGRQGDPGSTKFFLSLQDDLMRIFGGDQVKRIMDRFGMDENLPLEASLVTRSIETAQKRVEGFNFDRRKRLVEEDDVTNAHREVVYKLRRRILEIPSSEESYNWFVRKLSEHSDIGSAFWDDKAKLLGKSRLYELIHFLTLPVVDILWMDHLEEIDQMREGIKLQSYAQKDPTVEFKRESHERFELLIARIYSTIAERVRSISIQTTATAPAPAMGNLQYQHSEPETGVSEELSSGAAGAVQMPDGRILEVQTVSSTESKIGRNDLCPCGSGKKYKHCHGKS